MRPTEEISLADYRRLSRAQPRQRAKREPKAGIPRAPRDERTGLSTRLKEGWNVQSPDTIRYRLYKGDLDTGLCDDLKTACDRAKELSR